MAGKLPDSLNNACLQVSWASLVAQLEKNLPANAGDLGLIPGLGRSPGEGKGHPLQYSSLESSMDWISMASLSRTRVVLKGHLTPEGGVLSPCSGVAAAAAVGVVSRGSGVPLLGFIF